MLPVIETEAPTNRRSNQLNHAQQETRPLAIAHNWSEIPLARSNILYQEAIKLVTENIYYRGNQTIWTPREFITVSPTSPVNNYDANVEQFANGVVHPITKETITQYQKVKVDPSLGEVW